MGQAQQSRKRFFREHPLCCFCGGERQTEEIEHLPPRIMFLGKHRPKGFEFPICKRCNRASRKTDELVSFLAKFASYREDIEALQAEFDKQSRAIFRNCPESFDEILSGRYGNGKSERSLNQAIKRDVALVSVGEKQKEHLNLFAVKIAAGTYYIRTRKILSRTARFSVFIYTQFNDYKGTSPSELGFLGPFKTIEQGSWNVRDQFSYRYALTDECNAGVFEYLFHNNLHLVVFLFTDPSNENLVKLGNNLFTIDDIAPISDTKFNPYPTLSYSFSL